MSPGSARKGPSLPVENLSAPVRTASSTRSRKSDSKRGSRSTPLQVGPTNLGAAQQNSSPAIGCRIPDRAKEPASNVVWTGSNRQRRLEGEVEGMLHPCVVVLEGRDLAATAHANRQVSHQSGNAFQVDMNEHSRFHECEPQPSSPCRRARDGTRTRWGNRSSRRSSPIPSRVRSARSDMPSCMPRTNRTVAYIPMETPGSPRSILWSVVRLMRARSAIVDARTRRRRRASRISLPSFFRVRRTGSGKVPRM